jgi:HTH-type transcriptional repressor of NAD biosynthesis genes
MIGLVVGKFCPLHLGHEFLITTALAQVDRLLIISYTSRDLGFPPSMRKQMLTTRFPTTTVIVPVGEVPDDFEEETIHREFCFKLANGLNMVPDVIFSSEDYGPGFAEYLSKRSGKHVQHVEVDKARKKIPVSATMLRNDSTIHHQFIHPDVLEIMR